MGECETVRYGSETSPSPASSSRKASTLIEVLVVAALIALVVSLVVPALGRARDQANVVACRANLRSLLLASLVYAGEHDSLLPTDATVDNPHFGLIAMLSRGGYVDAMETYYCPSEQSPELRRCPGNFEAGNIGYFYYSFTERPVSRYLSNFLRKTIQWPRVLKTTMPHDVWVASDSWFSNMPTAHRYYKKGVNYVTLGGTAGMVRESPRAQFK
ncbi:MAG: type II secretion system protein [Phycisphaerales bacterium]|nr:MAG: type II secretion system protein [Phycisphaerales bacterium]